MYDYDMMIKVFSQYDDSRVKKHSYLLNLYVYMDSEILFSHMI